MSRDAGTTLDERLITYLSGGGGVVVARVVDGIPTCVLARGTAASPEELTVTAFDPVERGARVSVHTLGEAICMIAGDVTEAAPADTGPGEPATTLRIAVRTVKDDRPPGLAVVPFAFIDESGEGQR